MLVAFLPMFCIAYAYRYMNQADPDCGTTFSWATRGLGPSWGWLGGWAIVATDVIVMASLSQIAASVQATAEVVFERAPQALVDAGSKHDAWVLVVGAHGEGPIKGALLGSTAHKLLHLSERPVLVVPAG